MSDTVLLLQTLSGRNTTLKCGMQNWLNSYKRHLGSNAYQNRYPELQLIPNPKTLKIKLQD